MGGGKNEEVRKYQHRRDVTLHVVLYRGCSASSSRRTAFRKPSSATQRSRGALWFCRESRSDGGGGGGFSRRYPSHVMGNWRIVHNVEVGVCELRAVLSSTSRSTIHPSLS